MFNADREKLLIVGIILAALALIIVLHAVGVHPRSPWE
jgi:hypothetical protein